MILIFGGAYQGKLSYAYSRFNLNDNDVYLCDDINIDMPKNKKIVYEIDKWILALTKKGISVTKFLDDFIKSNNDVIVICNDISSGVVPLDDILRHWRENVGKALSKLSYESDEVVRIFCGIPMRIK